jgi:hypothetical protein
MPPTLHVWKSPRPADAAEAAAILASDAFEPSDDVTWFSRELTGDAPPIWNPDAPPKAGPHPDRVMTVTLEPETAAETLEDIYGLATKYDLVVYDPQRSRVDLPSEAMAAIASATFWPWGAIRALVATAIAVGIAAAAWAIGIPIVSGLVILFAAFMAAIFLSTFVVDGSRRFRPRR